MFTLFPNEKSIVTAENGKTSFALTSHRVLYENTALGKSYNQNIMLTDITSIENVNKKNFVLAFVTGVFSVCTIIMISNFLTEELVPGVAILGLLASIGLSVLFFYLYKQNTQSLLTIASPSTKMYINISGMPKEKVMELMNKIEFTKQERLQEKYKMV